MAKAPGHPAIPHRPTCGPSAEEWRVHKEEIINLYRQHTMCEVRSAMGKKYKFFASKRMYDTRLKQWKVAKNIKRADKDKMVRRLVQVAEGDEDSAVPLDFSKTQLRKVMRYIQSQAASHARQSGDESKLASNADQHRSDVASDEDVASVEANDSPARSPCDCETPSTNSSTDLPKIPTLGSGPARSTSNTSTPPEEGLEFTDTGPSAVDTLRSTSQEQTPPTILVLRTPLSFNTKLQTSELILSNVSRYFSLRLQAIPNPTTSNSILEIGTTPATKRFWSNIENGIYLRKLSPSTPPPRRASLAITSANALAPEVLLTEPFDFLRKLLLVLSPANTSIHPPLRQSMLKTIHSAAQTSLGPFHPITVITESLSRSASEDISLLSHAALEHMYNLAADHLGASHAVPYKLMGSIITLARRSDQLSVARGLAEVVLELAVRDHGPNSALARRAAVDLAHILTKMGRGEEALVLRLGVVEHDAEAVRDSIDIHVMEDIAEHYVNVGEKGEGLRWLRRAEKAAWRLWGDDVATLHVSDKVDEMLAVRCGRIGEYEDTNIIEMGTWRSSKRCSAVCHRSTNV